MIEKRIYRYLLYAVGEIVLVVIGILLALQINTWNQSRLNQKEEIRILKDLSEELQFSTFLKNTGLERMGEVNDAAERLLEDTKNPNYMRAEDQLAMDVHKLTWVWMAGRKTTLFDVLSGSGDFEQISSSTLRKKLADLKANQEILIEFEKTQFGFVDEQLRPYLNRTIDRTTLRSTQVASKQITSYHSSHFDSSINELLNDREFANLLQDLIFFTERLIDTYYRIEKDILTINSLIISKDSSLQAEPYIPY